MPSTKVLAILAAAVATTAASASTQFWDIGFNRFANRISDNGTVVGDDLNTQNYFLWTPANGATNIGGVVAGNGPGGQASISNDGLWVAGTNTQLDGTWGMARYNTTTGVWSETPQVAGGGVVDNNTSSGWGISGDGQTLVGLGWLANFNAHAISWSPSTGTVDLGTTSPGRPTRANATNFNGTVIGGWQDNDFGRQGAVWRDGSQQLIADSNGQIMGEVFGLSNNGTWAVGIQMAGFFGLGNLWLYNTETQQHQYLGNIPNGSGTAAATAVNDDGTMAVGGTWGFGPAFFGTGIIWTQNTGVITFAEYLDANNVAYDPGFSFSYVTDMSSDGTWFTGWGFNSDFQLTSWVVNIPTPGSVSVLALAGLMASRRRRA